MQGFLVTEDLQNEFVAAIQNDEIGNFLNVHHDTLVKLAELLKTVKVPRTARNRKPDPYDKVTILICKHFMELLEELVTPNTIKLPENSMEESFRQRLLIDGKSRKEWSSFYKKHEQFFDTVILWARHQHVVNIYIERNQKRYLLLEDARLGKNRIVEKKEMESGWLCCLLTKPNNSVEDNWNGTESNFVQTQQPTATINDNLPVSTNVSNVTTSSRVSSPIPSDPGSKHNSLDMVIRSRINREEGDQIRVQSPIQSQTPQDPARTDVTRQSTILRRDETRRTQTSRHGDPVTVHRTPTSASQESRDFAEQMRKMDDEFERKLNAQNAAHREAMQKLKEDRERINRETEEEIRKMREQSALRMRFFLQCVSLKMRWEEQQAEWEQWLKEAREPVLKVKMMFWDFTCKPYTMIRREYDGNDLKDELLRLRNHVQIAHDKMVDDFGNMVALSGEYEDKLFLKVIQRKICEMADKLSLLIEALDGFEDDEYSFSRIINREIDINPMDIPSATGLRRICDTANPDDYRYVVPPREIQRSGYNFTEI